MDGQRRLATALAVEVNTPPDVLDFNSLVAAFQRFGDLSTARCFRITLEALEEHLGGRLQAEEPGRYAWDGYKERPKQWILPFGRLEHRYHRLLDRRTGRHLLPLREGLRIAHRKRYSWAVLAGPVGLATELSFRRAAREGKRLQEGLGPSKSTTYDYFQILAESGLDPLPPAEEQTLEVLVADGTKLKRQQRGRNAGKMDLRLVLSQTRAGENLQVAAFDLDAAWPELKQRLRKSCPGERIEALVHDGEEAIDALADARTRVQRCLVHGPRGLRYALYQDGLKKPRQDPLLQHYAAVRAWRMDAPAMAELSEKSRYHLRTLVDRANHVCQEILEALPKGAVHARTYLDRFVGGSLSYLRVLLNREPPLPVANTNQIENIFSQLDLRLKEIGRRWSLPGAMNMLRVLLSKIFRGELWDEHLATLRGLPGQIVIEAKILSVGWES